MGKLRRGCQCQGCHPRPQWRIRCQYAEIAMPVDARWRHQGSNALYQLQRRELQLRLLCRLQPVRCVVWRSGTPRQSPLCAGAPWQRGGGRSNATAAPTRRGRALQCIHRLPPYAGQLKPSLEVLDHGAIQQGSLGVARVVELGLGAGTRVRVRVLLRWTCGGGYGAVPPWADQAVSDSGQIGPTSGIVISLVLEAVGRDASLYPSSPRFRRHCLTSA